MADTVRAGVARVELPVQLGDAMMGYGARRGTAESVHDTLSARALYVEGAEGRVLLVECDVCLLAVSQCDALRARIAAATPLAVGEIVVASIHTHSGPETGVAALVAGRAAPPGVAALLDAVVRVGVAAVEAAVPAAIGVGRAAAAIGRNRRCAGGPVDERVLALRVDRATGEPLAVLFVHGCHPTVLGHDNLALSADWPAEARAVVEAGLPGALALFALGAHADVDPRTRGLQDLALADQSRGADFAAAAELGREVGEAAAKAAASVVVAGSARVRTRAVRVALDVHGGSGEQRRAHLARLRADALDALGEAPGAELRTQDFYRREAAATRGLEGHERRERIARVRRYLRDRDAARIAGGERCEVEVQLVELGPLELLALPLEVTVDVGADWTRRLASDCAGILSIANGWLRYLPYANHFEGPTAHHQYEVLNSTFTAGAAARLLDAGESLRR